MAKNMRRFLAIALALTLCFMLMAPTASAWGWNPPGYGDNDSYEWYEVYVQGNLAASGQGRKGDVYFLGTHYEADVDFSGNTLTWHINPIGGSSGNFSGTVNLSDYIEIPEGYTVQDYDIEELSIDGVNDPVHNMYDNAVIRITIKSLYNEDTDDTIVILDPDPDPVDPEPTEPVDYAPVLTIIKTADKEVYEIGETVTWTITVTNTGSDTAYDVIIIDPLTGDTWEIDYLAAGESCTVTATATALEAGSLANTAIVNWTDNDEIPDEDETDEPKTGSDTETVTVREPVDYAPVLSITKTADKDVYEIGETVTWTITVTNTGSDAAYDVVIIDPLTGDTWEIDCLAAGESYTVTVTATALEAGSLANTAIVNWTDNDEIPDEDEIDEPKTGSDTETVTIEEPEVTEPEPTEPEPTEPVDYAPALSITKTADKEVYEIGETVTWTITVTNTGSDTAYDVVIIDPLTGDTWEIDYLAAGESYTVTVTATALEAGSLANTAIVNWTDNDEIPDEDEIDEPKTGSDTETVTIEEPEVTEPDPTESEPTEPAPSETDPVESDPEVTEPNPQPDKPNDNYGIDPYADIPDEDVPLADVPVTGDISLLWAALSIFSGAALVAVNTKRKED